VRNIFKAIKPEQSRILGFTRSKPLDLIISTLAVAPPQIRPSIEMNPEKKAED
jgi:DNA-directed RNA polymerase beta' subunit